MRAPSRVAFVAWFVISAGGCAAVTGLDQISEQACAPHCDGGGDVQSGADVTTDTPGNDVVGSQDVVGPNDVSTGTDGTEEPEEASTSDGPTETSTSESGTDAGVDAPVDAPPDVKQDAAADSGCGSLSSIDNCGACNVKCNETNASGASCNGTTCSYTCDTNYLDCNAGAAPDIDGCECHSPGATISQCCSGTCPIPHNYDEDLTPPATFYDCVAAGQYNVTVATDACAAYTGNAAECDSVYQDYYCTYEDGGLAGDMVCSDGASKCVCWGYSGALQGHMVVGPGSEAANPNNCECPEPTDPSWD